MNKLYFDALVSDAQKFQSQHDRAKWVDAQASEIVKKYDDQRVQAEFALALIPQLPREIVPLLRFPATNKCYLGDTNIELVCSWSCGKPLFQKYTLHSHYSEHFTDYRLALARLADLRAQHQNDQQEVAA